MSDSEDDWESKDVDEMLREIQKKTQEASIAVSAKAIPIEGVSQNPGQPPFFFDQDFGGRYEIKPASKNSSKGGKSKQDYLQRTSAGQLKTLLDSDPLRGFIAILQRKCGFFKYFDESIPPEHVPLVIHVFAKLCELPFEEYRRDFLRKFVSSDTLFRHLESFFDSENYPSTAIDDFIYLSWKVKSSEVEKRNVRALLQKLEAKHADKHQLQTKIQNILNAFEDDYQKYKEIYPSLDELKSDALGDVKLNITEGKYPSVDEYVGTHLSLLREDFIAPIRDIVNELRGFESLEAVSSKQLYKATRFGVKHTTYGPAFLVDFMPKDRGEDQLLLSGNHASIYSAKKLMYGSLLCFTSSLQFEDLILGVVSRRDDELVSKGFVHVEIVKMYNVGNIFNRDFIMFESETYFEPYQHVYRVLRGLHKENFPLADYIVNVECNARPPDYLRGRLKYTYKYQEHSFNPLDLESYPPCEVLGLDKSQYEAIQHSLSQKFSLIQGPPGTGKTFIGFKILSMLLKNVDAPILVVCYTNHALDQFLLGVLETTQDVVRLGNQSKHEILDAYNIRQMIERSEQDWTLKHCRETELMAHTSLMSKLERLEAEGDKEENYEEIMRVQEDIRRVSAKLHELKQILDFQQIKGKKVIGMTTTFASRNHSLLQLLKVPIVIVEEAAEVLESHIIAAITQSTEHLILIGDHQQLRPTTSVYRLSEKYKMNISLFERMIKNKLHSVCLNTQHRMRPDIANLLRPTIYEDLNDADIVRQYKDIRGMSKNLFFVNHDFKELKASERNTKKNVHEVLFLLSLADYLLSQGYNPQDIVILCTYNGQAFEFISEIKRRGKIATIRVSVVDNFQGEESKIILLSLVRKNDENNIGFLAMKNRICVALSRAKEGFYAIGAIDFLARNNSIWRKVKATLKDQDAIGDALPLLCRKHGVVTEVRTDQDFQFFKEGRCCRSSNDSQDVI